MSSSSHRRLRTSSTTIGTTSWTSSRVIADDAGRFASASGGKARPMEGARARASIVTAHEVVFRSLATNLVRVDTNGYPDVFVRNWVASTTNRVNLSSAGAEANQETYRGSLAAGMVVVSPSDPRRATWSLAGARMARRTSSCTTGSRRRIGASASLQPAPRRTHHPPGGRPPETGS